MAKSKFGGFGGSSSDTKSYVKSLADVSAAVKYLSDNVAGLSDEQQKQLKIIKQSNDANNKLSQIIADQAQPAYSDFAKQIKELEKIQKSYNEKMKVQGKEMMEQISLTQAYETKLKALNEKKKKLQQDYTTAVDDNTKAQISAQQTATANELAKIEAALKLQEEATKQKIQKYDEEVRKFEEAEGAKRKALTETVEEGKKAYDSLMQKADESFKKPMKGMGDFADRTKVALEGIQGQIDTFAKMGSLGDISRFGIGFGESLQTAGANMKAMGGVMGKMGGGIAALGGALSKALGPIGIIISIAETFMQAEKDQKDFNKAILEGGGALDFMAKESDNLHENLNSLRKGMLDYTNLTRLGMSPEEMRSTLNSLQESNLTLKKMAPNASNIKQQFEGAKTLIGEMKTVSTVFGVGIEEVTSHVVSLNMNLGKTLDEAEELKNIKSSFDQIRDAASQAGYSNKKFFSTIISVTNEVGSMNGRVAEAGSLFVRLRKLIGKKGEEVFESVKEGYKGKSVQEKVTDVYKVGGKKTKQILQREAVLKGQALFGAVDKDTGGELSKGVYGGKQLGELEKILGPDLVKGLREGNEEAIKKISQMDAGKKADILRTIQSTEGLGADVANTIQDFMTLSRGVAGNMGATINALEKMGMGGNLAMMVNKLNFVGLSADKLSETTLENVATQELLSQTFGENKEAVTQLLSRGIGEYKNYSALVDQYNKETDEKKKKEIEEKLNKEGLGIKEGKLIAKGSGKEIKDFSSFIQALPERFKPLEDMATSAKSQEELLQESIDATVASSDAIGAILKEKLDFLGNLTSGIFSWITGDDDKKKKQKIQDQEKLSEELRSKESALSKNKEYRADVLKQYRAETDPTKKKALKDKIDDIDKELKKDQKSIELDKATSKQLSKYAVKDRGTAENMARYELAKQVYDRAGGDQDKEKALAAVDAEFEGGWARKELEAREKLRNSKDEKDQKKLREIETGSEDSGGSAFEIESAKKEDELYEKYVDSLDTSGSYIITPYQQETLKNLDDFRAEKKKYTFKVGDSGGNIGAMKAADEQAKKDEQAKLEQEELNNKLLEEERKLQYDIANDTKLMEKEATIKFEAEYKGEKKYKQEKKKEYIDQYKEANLELYKTKETQETEKQAKDIQELYLKQKKSYTLEQIKAAIEKKKAAEIMGGEDAVKTIEQHIKPAQDLIISDKGAFRLNSKDDILAMKPGGAVEEYVKSTGGGMGKGGNVTININGGDEARVFEVVKKAMKSAGVVTQGGL